MARRNPNIPGRIAFAEPDGALTTATIAELLVARDGGQLRQLLDQIEARTSAGEVFWGYLGYEAAGALDPALVTHPAAGLPLAAFARLEGPPQLASTGPWWLSPLRSELGAQAYRSRVAAVRAAIGRGETYQVNLTMRLAARFGGDPLGLLRALVWCQGVAGLGFELPGATVVCASPELFLLRRGRDLTMRPMKGTCARGRDGAEDQRLAAQLRESAKERAENLMIVDMVRNDLGRIAEPGSVVVPRLFDLERYPTVWQMTSTVTAQSDCGLVALLRATFPCASVTGAPKASTMAHIRDLEIGPRGVYTGAIGRFGPGPDLDLAVAIRTAVVDTRAGRVHYGVGSGITWDSRAGAEHAECLAKARVATAIAAPDLELVETMLADGLGVRRRALHLERLRASAAALGFLVPGNLDEGLDQRLAQEVGKLERPTRVRLALLRRGVVRVTTAAAPRRRRGPVDLVLASLPIPEGHWTLAHKTSNRDVYQHLLDATAADHPGVEEVLLWSERDGVSETNIASVLYQLGGCWYTPVARGQLLPGRLRAQLLARGRVVERPLPLGELAAVERLVLASSLRGLRPARLITTTLA
jgi:para-aminobenzoate synthetase/4-amino-4-deoxychorismate lyase